MADDLILPLVKNKKTNQFMISIPKKKIEFFRFNKDAKRAKITFKEFYK